MSGSTVILKNKGLLQLIKALKTLPTARIGVLGGNKNTRKDAGPTNAEIGAGHEFGTDKLPMRSFLRQPLADNLEKRMAASGAFDRETLAEVIRTGTIRPYVAKMAVLGEGIVQEAFDTGGFGKWKPSNMEHKSVKQTLVETQQLRNAITSEVK